MNDNHIVGLLILALFFLGIIAGNGQVKDSGVETARAEGKLSRRAAVIEEDEIVLPSTGWHNISFDDGDEEPSKAPRRKARRVTTPPPRESEPETAPKTKKGGCGDGCGKHRHRREPEIRYRDRIVEKIREVPAPEAPVVKKPDPPKPTGHQHWWGCFFFEKTKRRLVDGPWGDVDSRGRSKEHLDGYRLVCPSMGPPGVWFCRHWGEFEQRDDGTWIWYTRCGRCTGRRLAIAIERAGAYAGIGAMIGGLLSRGASGARGDAGSNGRNGANGNNGAPGTPGAPGAPGTPGAPGAPGVGTNGGPGVGTNGGVGIGTNL